MTDRTIYAEQDETEDCGHRGQECGVCPQENRLRLPAWLEPQRPTHIASKQEFRCASSSFEESRLELNYTYSLRSANCFKDGGVGSDFPAAVPESTPVGAFLWIFSQHNFPLVRKDRIRRWITIKKAFCKIRNLPRHGRNSDSRRFVNPDSPVRWHNCAHYFETFCRVANHARPFAFSLMAHYCIATLTVRTDKYRQYMVNATYGQPCRVLHFTLCRIKQSNTFHSHGFGTPDMLLKTAL